MKFHEAIMKIQSENSDLIKFRSILIFVKDLNARFLQTLALKREKEKEEKI